MFIEQIPKFIRLLYKPVLWRKDEKIKKIYLTFDDGPNEHQTEWILDELDKFGIKATFFCIGRQAKNHPELIKEIINRGHKIGMHGYSHVRGLYKKSNDFYADIEDCEEYINSNLFRPPHGRISPKQAWQLSKKYTIVLWDVITRDYDQNLEPEKIYKIATKYTRNGSIIVFHDSLKASNNMRYAFPKAVEYWLKKGYEFGTL